MFERQWNRWDHRSESVRFLMKLWICILHCCIPVFIALKAETLKRHKTIDSSRLGRFIVCERYSRSWWWCREALRDIMTKHHEITTTYHKHITTHEDLWPSCRLCSLLTEHYHIKSRTLSKTSNPVSYGAVFWFYGRSIRAHFFYYFGG